MPKLIVILRAVEEKNQRERKKGRLCAQRTARTCKRGEQHTHRGEGEQTLALQELPLVPDDDKAAGGEILLGGAVRGLPVRVVRLGHPQVSSRVQADHLCETGEQKAAAEADEQRDDDAGDRAAARNAWLQAEHGPWAAQAHAAAEAPRNPRP
mgnify:CR=1 FL=1